MRLIVLLLGLLWATWLTGAAAPDACATACASAWTDAHEAGTGRPAAVAADAAGETEAPPATPGPAPEAGPVTARPQPLREPVPRAPWLAGLLRPPRAA